MTPPAPQHSRKGVFAVVLGNAVEYFDFGVYATFAVLIGQVFFPSENAFASLMASVVAFGIGFVVRPLGAVLIGAWADRVGRKPAMLLTMVLMALGTGGIAVLPGYDQIGIAAPILLVLTRLLQGLAWGGEAGPATTYILEAAPMEKRGTYACWQVVAQGLAAMAAGLIGYGLTLWLTPEQLYAWGWRLPFLLGLVILPIGFYIRRGLADTYADTSRRPALVLGELVREQHQPLLLGLLILSGSTITQYFLNYMTTFALVDLGLPADTAMLATLVMGAAMAVCSLAGGILSDRYGRRIVLILPRLAFLVLLFPAMELIIHARGTATFLITLAVLSGLHGMSGAALIVLLVESFPRRVRATGFSLVYAVGVTVFGGTAQIVVTWLIVATGDRMAPAGYLLVANLVCLGAAWFAAETCPNRQPGARSAP